MNDESTLPEGLGTLLRSLLARLDPVVEALYREQVPAMRSRFYPVMKALVEMGEGGINRLAKTARVSQPAMTQTVEQMVQAGLLERDISRDDARARVIRLSNNGKAAAEKLTEIWRRVGQTVSALDAELEYPLSQILNDAHAALDREDFAARLARQLEMA